VRALSSRLRVVNEAAMTEVELWSKGAGAQLDAQLQGAPSQLRTPLGVIERIQGAAGNSTNGWSRSRRRTAAWPNCSSKLNELTSLLTSNDAAGGRDG
jgi:hypothetical protein